MPTAPRQQGGALSEFHFPLPPGRAAMCCKSSTS